MKLKKVSNQKTSQLTILQSHSRS